MSQESIYVPGETYTSARATPELVGREKELGQIEDAIRDTENSYIVYVTGQGGIGKTRLVKYVLGHFQGNDSLLVSRELLDLYHSSVHTIEGATLALQKVLSPEDEKGFTAFSREYEKLTQFFVKGASTDIDVHQQRLRLGQAFVEDLNRLSAERRIILALDTAERLFPLADPTAEPLGLAEEYPGIWEWLLHTFLPQIENVVVLLAGRPGSGKLEAALEQIEGKQLLPIHLMGLNADEANRYFDALTVTARASQDHDIAERIEGLDDQIREVIYHALCDYGEDGRELGIRPILLSLVIDHLAISGRPSPALQKLFQQPDTVDFTQVRHQIESDLVSEFMNTPRPANDAIRIMAWLRKGADAPLLARVAGLRESDDTWDEEQAQVWLQSIRDLSFVKIRPQDQRVFLHDEMYDLLQRYVLDTPAYEWQKQRVWDTVTDYYKGRIETIRQEIMRLYTPKTEQELSALEALSHQRGMLEEMLVENLHYGLQVDLVDGFDLYLLYAEEALAANDESLDMHLRADLFTTIAQRRDYALEGRKRASDSSVEAEWDEQIETIDCLVRDAVIPDAAVRWVKRLTQQGRYQDALAIAERLQGNLAHLVEPGGVIAQADLSAWTGIINAYQGNYQDAEIIVRKASLEIGSACYPSQVWRRIVQGRLHNNLGYIARINGRVVRASKIYTNALPYWRDLGLTVDQANTLNNLSYALAIQGRFGEARRQGKEALNLRKQLGPQPPVVLSLTTLAEVEILAGQYSEAERYARQALRLAEAIEFERGKGFALLALATLHRFQADPQETDALEERRRFLDTALGHSEDALSIFGKLEEWEGKFTAFYEKAIALRERCRLAQEGGYPEWTPAQVQDKFEEAEASFLEAAGEAERHKRWDLYLDASMGRAWLHYYLRTANLEDVVGSVIDDVERLAPEYLIGPARWPGVGETTIVMTFAQLGRYHILQGILALDRANVTKEQAERAMRLAEAGSEFALAFEYNRQIAEDFRDLQRGIAVVYDRLRKLNVKELTIVFDGIKQVWGQQMPEQGGPGNIREAEDILFWRILEEHFGAYDKLRELVS